MINYNRLLQIAYSIPVDMGGGSIFSKTAIMASLAEHFNFKIFVEIGVYRGRCFFPIAASMSEQGGYCYGIDPYTTIDALEEQIPEGYYDQVQLLIKTTDWNALYTEVLERRRDFHLESSTEIIRKSSAEAAEFFKNKLIDLLHIDGNHDTRFVMQDVENYIPLLRNGGVLVLDDTNWESVKPALTYASERLDVIFEAGTYTILVRRDRTDSTHDYLPRTCRSFEVEAKSALEFSQYADTPIVSVSMITFNQERYIGRAIESALEQSVAYKIEIVIGEDHSSDGTLNICRRYQSENPDKIRLLEWPANLGAVRNYLETYKACNGRYVAFLEGDDFWIDPNKIDRQVKFLEGNPDYAICCHEVLLADENGFLGERLLGEVAETTSVRDLCTGDYISTPSCMIRNRQVKAIPEWVYTLPGCDWTFDILNAECGLIKYMPEPMAAYRKHGEGIWSKRSPLEQNVASTLLALKLNHYLDYRYNNEFGTYIYKTELDYRMLAMQDFRENLAQPQREVTAKGRRGALRKLRRRLAAALGAGGRS